MAITEELKKALGKPLGKIPSGVYILTSRHEGSHAVMLASWIQQAGFDPPCISIAVAKERPIFETIRKSGRLAVSIIPQGDTTLFKKFARGPADAADPFKDVPTMATPGGVLAPSEAVAVIEGKLIEVFEFGGDHALVVAEVTWAELARDGQPYVHVRNNGFSY